MKTAACAKAPGAVVVVGAIKSQCAQAANSHSAGRGDRVAVSVYLGVSVLRLPKDNTG